MKLIKQISISTYVLSLTCLFAGAAVNGKEKVPVKVASGVEFEKALYAEALGRGDAITAQSTAARLVLMDPEDAVKWKFELCKLLYLGGNLDASLKLCEQLIKDPPTGTLAQLQELQATCQEGLGLKEAAKKSWTLVFEESKNPLHAVRLAGLQFEGSELQDALITIEAGLIGEGVDKLVVTVPKSEKEVQQVSARAALLNLKGLVALKKDSGAKDVAKADFEAALKASPDFEIAKRNIASLAPAPDAGGPSQKPSGSAVDHSPSLSTDSATALPGSPESAIDQK